jgi:hypothetical protein
MPVGSEPGEPGEPGGAGAPGPAVPELPARFRPLGVRVAGWLFGAALLAVGTVVWLTLPQEGRDAFTTLQRGTVVLMFLTGVAVGHALGRCRVDADEQGLHVVNGYRSRHLAWPQVVAVRLPPGNPWATLDLADGTNLAVMGIQGSDGKLARQQVRRLRALIEAHAGREPGS